MAIHSMAEVLKANTFREKLIRWLAQRAYAPFDRVVSSSLELKQNLVKLGVESDKITVIHNGVDVTRFHPCRCQQQRQQLRLALRLPHNPKDIIVLFVGLKTPRKGVLPLVQGWKEYRERGGLGHLVLVGPERREDPNLADFYIAWDKELLDAKNYNIELRPSHSAIEQFFQACDVFVFLSDKEGLPNVIPEAMACGIPALINHYDGFSNELARTAIDYLPTTRDPHRIADDLQRIIDNEDLREDLGKNSRAWVEQQHALDTSIASYCDLIGQLA